MNQEVEDYLSFIKKSRSDKTYLTYKNSLRTFVKVVGEGAEISKDTYIKFLKETSGSMNQSSQAICKSAIKGLYFFAADKNSKIEISFFEQVNKRYALRSSKKLILFNRDGIEKIIEYIIAIRNKPEDLRDKTFILLLADSGLRMSEACNIKIGDMDLLEQKVVVVGKGDQEAVVHFSDRTRAAIMDYMGVHKNRALSTPLFVRHDKKVGSAIRKVKPDGMWHMIKRRAEEAGVDPKTIRPHDFRHYFVTVVYHAGGMMLAKELARHKRVETTGRYAHLIDDDGEAYSRIFNKG